MLGRGSLFSFVLSLSIRERKIPVSDHMLEGEGVSIELDV